MIWNDADDDGVQDTTEAGISGLKVTLLDSSGNPVPGVAPVVTNANGDYYFGNLTPGTYSVLIESNTTDLADYIMNSGVQNSNADDNNASDSNIDSGNVASGYTSAQITLAPNSEPYGGDENSNLPNNGDNADGNANDLTDRSGNMTLDMGFAPPASLGDRVWIDADHNGIQDAGEE